MTIKCALCGDCGWACERYPERPWDGDHACGCGAAGVPCVRFNPSDRDNPPRPPAGMRIEFDKHAGATNARRAASTRVREVEQQTNGEPLP
jgi:hypothetical protein